MNQENRRKYLIECLLAEKSEYGEIAIPENISDQKQLLRGLMNIRPAQDVDESFLRVQDEYLTEEIKLKGITDISDLTPVENGIYLWQGDITTLRCDAIVNAANSGMTGCYVPCHGCIDNAIHTFAGVKLRKECLELMATQGHEEPAGMAKITKAYNLPCRYILHTVGPIISGRLDNHDEELLRSCYESCLRLATDNGIRNIAFCCISTGEFHFPNKRAAEIAVQTARGFREENDGIEVIFNVWKDIDLEIYQGLLGQSNEA